MIYINDKAIQISNWELTLLQQCELLGISIPRFCYHKELSIAGNCRMCMVEVKNSIKPVIACSTSIMKGMTVYTNSDLVKTARENVLEFLLINHPLDCPICDQGGECDLQDQTMIYGSDRGRFKEIKRSVEDKEFGPVIKTIMTRCIHCTRCVRFAEEIAGMPILGTMGRGKETEISTYVNKLFLNEISGNIVDICPVGALTSKPYSFKARPWELGQFDSTDILDSFGSSIRIDVKGNEILRILPRRNDLINGEWISDKIRFSYQGLKIDRGVSPMYKNDFDALLVCSWSKAFYLYSKNLATTLPGESVVFTGATLSIGELQTIQNYVDILDFVSSSKLSINSSNLRSNWLLNQSVDSILRSDILITLNTNVRLFNTILNAHITKEKFARSDSLSLYTIGDLNSLTANNIHLSNSTSILNDIYEGRSFLNKNFLSTKNTTIINTTNSLISSNSINRIYNIANNITISNIAANCSELNSLELGVVNIVSSETYDNNFSFYHIIGNELNTYPMNANFVVLQSPYIPTGVSPDLYLPSESFVETSGYYLNTLGQYCSTLKAIDAAGLAWSNIKIINTLFEQLMKYYNNASENTSLNDLFELKNNFQLPVYDKRLLESNIYEYNSFFTDKNEYTLIPNFLFSNNDVSSYYCSDSISIRSKTLQQVYTLLK